jgi:ADP-ribose pyrophosphatase YjhB (NUDIX family)
MIESPSISVLAVVPLSDESGDEVLMFREPGAARLPSSPLRRGEHLLDAASRIVQEQAGFRPIPRRIVYLLESPDETIRVGVLCGLPDDEEEIGELRGEFVPVSKAGDEFQPLAMLEPLMEDLRSGFFRPVAHIIETFGEHGRTVSVTW